ncbi:hypothetical protein R6L23_16575 [Streptomyces sp. SR27]|uniref:DUF7373 family lipoprotein n=1 Tax=Streptomyces sp. SR27 TaxID=3076630 RepID=UPI00295C3760|nr:hypothetical protein [Streptomyces sp. SR27]MDV9189812.1 hypothetical protein [Streptomyces sp. SR27]
MAMSAALVAALTACGGGGGDTAGPDPVNGGRQNGDSLEGHEDTAPAVLTGTQLQTVLSGNAGIPEAWGGRSPEAAKEGAEAVERCGADAGTGCAGLTAMALRVLENQTLEQFKADVDGQTMFVNVYSFDSAENAAVTAKALSATERNDAKDARPLKITTGAEDTDAFSEKLADGEYSANAVLRAGTVVITLWGTDLKGTEDMQPIAKRMVDRVLKVAAGKNPDA